MRLDQPLQDRLDGVRQVALQRTLQDVDPLGARRPLTSLERAEPICVSWRQRREDGVTKAVLTHRPKQNVERMTDRQGIAWTPGEREEQAAPPSRDETRRHRPGMI